MDKEGEDDSGCATERDDFKKDFSRLCTTQCLSRKKNQKLAVENITEKIMLKFENILREN